MKRLISHNTNLIKNNRDEALKAQKLHNDSKISLDKLQINLSNEKRERQKLKTVRKE